jgi:hypothetical protein
MRVPTTISSSRSSRQSWVRACARCCGEAINLDLVVSRDQILTRVWGDDFDGQSNIVDVYVSAIRRKLRAAGARNTIATVWASDIN